VDGTEYFEEQRGLSQPATIRTETPKLIQSQRRMPLDRRSRPVLAPTRSAKLKLPLTH
jgi:hypothetical protein